jgi:FlaA1/EpsC-like NDP-sugar epimerase
MRRWYRSGAFPVHRHSLVQLLVDGGLVALAYMLAFELRFDNGIPGRYDLLRDGTVLWVVPLCVVVFAAFGLYQRLWTYVGQRDYEALVRAVVVSAILVIGGIAFLHPVQVEARNGVELAVGLPMGVAAMWVLLTLFLTAGVRFLAHLVFEGRAGRGPRMKKGARTVLIVGGGDGGRLVVRELIRNPDLGLRPVGFVDDDPRKRGMKDEHHLRVLGTTSEQDLRRVLDTVEPDEVIVAIPSAPGTLRGRIVAACRPRGIPVRTLPTVFELLQDGNGGGVRVMRQLRELQVEDVLGREPVRMELERVGAYLANQVVLVTGAGGSIGGELCRQIARVGPRKLVLVDHAEDNLFEIARELEDERHVRTAVPVLADCKEEERMREVLAEHRPAIVFHAAAYKHVGMMELNPVEAVRNNALATRLVARIAGELGVKTFVLVSTDKAVSPATVMGASKALAEWAVEAAAERHPGTRFATVRFGNVLGSSGSVVPIFRRQIAAGGPVTVTDARMQRYFMTIPEAVQLIIRSGSLSERSGEVFVLEMGEPVLIVDLAKAMIRLSGYEPDKDIAIEVVGAKPGEKLHEELFNPFERPQPTPAEKILRAERPRLDPDWVERTFDEVNLFVLEDDAAALAAKVGELSAVRTAAPIADQTATEGRNAADRRNAGPAVGVPSSDA